MEQSYTDEKKNTILILFWFRFAQTIYDKIALSAWLILILYFHFTTTHNQRNSIVIHNDNYSLCFIRESKVRDFINWQFCLYSLVHFFTDINHARIVSVWTSSTNYAVLARRAVISDCFHFLSGNRCKMIYIKTYLTIP